jgi:alpha-glucosidase
VLAEFPGERLLLGEVALPWTERVARYCGEGDALHLAFNFPPLFAPWSAAAWRERIAEAVAQHDPRSAWPTWVLSNHDNPRHRTRYGSEARARAAAVLLLTLRGTPCLYAGEELGLEDARIEAGRRLDPGGRDGCRAPIPWQAAAPHGWTGADPWLPWPPETGARSAEALRADPGSILHLYRRLLRARRASPALALGRFELLPAADDVLVYRRERDGDARIVCVNFADEPRELGLPGDFRVEVASDGAGEGRPFAGRLAASQALILAAGAGS